MKSRKILLFGCIIIFMGLVIILYFAFGKTTSIDQSTIIQQFEDNRVTFNAIKDYAIKSDGYMFIARHGAMVNNKDDEKLLITDENALSNINYLKSSLSFLAIYEGQDDTLFFMRYLDRKYEKGIAYISNGEIPLAFIKTEFLGDNWYYYESGKV